MAEPSIIERSVEKAHVWLDRVAADAELDGGTSASYAVSAAAEALRRHVSAGEIDDVRAQLPEDLLPILG